MDLVSTSAAEGSNMMLTNQLATEISAVIPFDFSWERLSTNDLVLRAVTLISSMKVKSGHIPAIVILC